MPVSVVQLGTPRLPDEGLRIGTVRRPPRGVPKSEFSSGDWYDVWLPNLAPSAPLVKQAMAGSTPRELTAFKRKYRSEMSKPEASRVIDLLAALSQTTNFSVGCYCEEFERCHRSVLIELLCERGAKCTNHPAP